MVRPGILDPWWSQQQMCLLSSGDKAAVAAAWSVSRLNNFQGMLPGWHNTLVEACGSLHVSQNSHNTDMGPAFE